MRRLTDQENAWIMRVYGAAPGRDRLAAEKWALEHMLAAERAAGRAESRAGIAAEVLAPIEALIETDGAFLKKDTKIKRVQEDRRHDLGAIVTTSMVTVDDLRAALSTAKEASE